MRRELLMPKLGLTMAEGTISEWCVPLGDVYQKGDCLFVVETEKIANEVAADEAGTLTEILVAAGETVPVGAVVAYAEQGGEAPAAGAGPSFDDAKAAKEQPDVTPPADTRPESTQLGAPDSVAAGRRVIASPLARRLARERGIDLHSVRGSGPRGRIVARDIESAPAQIEKAADVTQPYSIVEPTALQKTAATRLAKSKQEAPHFYLSLEADVSRLLELRRELNEFQRTQNQPTSSINDFIIKAVATALRQLPEANSVWSDEGIRQFTKVGVGMAIDTPAGLVAPTLDDIGDSSLGRLSARTRELIERARSSRLDMDDMGPAAITVSNAGMHNVTYMSSIINPGQAMILGVGSIKGVFRPDAAGAPMLKQEMGLVLSADHRIIDGVRALEFLNAIVRLLEQPLTLLAD